MLADSTIGMRSAACHTARFSASPRPVVPITTPTSRSAARDTVHAVAAGAVKSMITSASASASSSSDAIGTPELAEPGDQPGVVAEVRRARALDGGDQLAPSASRR